MIKRFAFHRSGENKMLHVYESPIDMMSYLTLYPDAIKDHHVALCCLADTSLQEYVKHYDIQRIFLHLDNDEWGRNQTEKIKKTSMGSHTIFGMNHRLMAIKILMNSWQVEKDEGQKKNNPDKQRRGTEITGFFERYRDEFFGLC